MEDLFSYVRAFIVAMILNFIAYIKPLGDEIFILAMVFIINFVAGLLSDIVVKHSTFQFKKAWRCIVELTVFFVMVVVVYTYGEKKGWPIGATQCVSFLTYIITYFYGLNVLRNMKSIFRKNTIPYKVFGFLYYVMSAEVIKRIPYLQDYLNFNGEDNGEIHS